MIAKLIPLDGTEPIAVTRHLTVVGRKKELCDLVLESSSVSKVHCAIAKTDGLLFIRDLGSTNGTKVNGQRVSRGALLPGDELAFANVRFRVHLGPSDEDEDEPSAEVLASRRATLEDSLSEMPYLEAESESDFILSSDD